MHQLKLIETDSDTQSEDNFEFVEINEIKEKRKRHCCCFKITEESVVEPGVKSVYFPRILVLLKIRRYKINVNLIIRRNIPNTGDSNEF